MSRLGQLLALAVLVSAFPSTLYGQLSDLDRSQLVAEIETASKELDATLFPDLQASQTELLQRVDSVKQFLANKTDASNRDAWLDYLNLDPLLEQIELGESPVAVGRESIRLRYRLVGTAPGLELTALRNLRDSAEQLIEAVRFRDKEKSIVSLTKQLESLAKRIKELDDNPSADDSAAISTLLGVLESSGQAKQLVHSLRETFNRPNLAILISEPMVQAAINQDINQNQPVNECILGTRLIGNASLNGVVTANLLPAVGAARINLTMVAQVVSTSIGYNGPVRLRTVGHGDVNVSQAMNISETGIMFEPALTTAVLDTQITSIEHKLALVRKIARKRAAQQKPKAHRIALAKLRNKVGSQFESKTSETVAATPDAFANIRSVLKRLSLQEPTRDWESTDQAVFIDSIFRRDDQLSSVVSRPPITETFDAAIQIQESVIDNACAPVLAGRTLKESQLNEMLEKIGREAPPPATNDEGDPEPPFEIDFARLRPIIFEARDQTLRIGVRGTRFAQGTRELKQAMEITAIYEPELSADGVAVLRRKGEVGVSFAGRKRLSVSQAGIKRTIQKKFSDVFPEVVLDRPLEVPADATIATLRGRVFHPCYVDANDGWLTVGIR